MFETILQFEIQKFINENLQIDAATLALRKNPFPNTDWAAILNQIASKAKAKTKLPSWFSTDKIIYPRKLSIEQASSEITAAHKASIVSGASLIDLSGGFGIDDYYFSKTVSRIMHCELNEELSAIVNHNFSQLGIQNVKCISGDSAETLKRLDQKFDWIYVDPSRRHDTKGKVILLADCEPNVPQLQNFYFNYSNNLLVKAAPVLDISAAIRELQFVKTVYVVAVENEVKELLFEIVKGNKESVEIKTVNFSKSGDQFFKFNLEHADAAPLADVKRYLFEPNAAIMKSGGFDQVAHTYPLFKLHQHSHLYTSEERIDFPGRVFEILLQFPYNKTEMKQHLEHQKANISIRNFGESVENIRKKWKIKDGGERYCFFTTDRYNRKLVLICRKI